MVARRHVRNPNSQWWPLKLSCMSLTDHHLIALEELLPTFQSETIDFSNIDVLLSQSLLEFARQFPRIHSWESISCQSSPSKESPLVTATSVVQPYYCHHRKHQYAKRGFAKGCPTSPSLVGLSQRSISVHHTG